MKLYVLDGGRVHLPDRNHLTPDRNVGIPVTIPILMFFIDHPSGLAVVDTGLDTVASDAPFLEVTPEQRIDAQMRRLGYAPEQVKYVVLTHLHLDHAGCMDLFPQATFVVRRSELRAAWWPDAYEAGYDSAGLLRTRDFKYLQVPDGDAFDLFLDGSVICFDTSGHSEGHQSVLVDLPNSGKIVLVGDAVQVAENFTDKVPPGVCWSSRLAVQAMERLEHMQREGALLIFGHELSLLDTLVLSPDYYD